MGSEGWGYLWKNSSVDDAEEEELTQCIWGNTHTQYTHTHLCKNSVFGFLCSNLCVCVGLVLKSDPDSETESEASEGSHDLGSRTESPELDDVKGAETQAMSQITEPHGYHDYSLSPQSSRV